MGCGELVPRRAQLDRRDSGAVVQRVTDCDAGRISDVCERRLTRGFDCPARRRVWSKRNRLRAANGSCAGRALRCCRQEAAIYWKRTRTPALRVATAPLEALRRPTFRCSIVTKQTYTYIQTR